MYTIQQIDGLLMGNPIAPQLAIIFMHYLEHQVIARHSGIVAWLLYIDESLSAGIMPLTLKIF